MLPSRAWELLSGSFLAYTGWTPKRQLYKIICVILGLILMISSVIFCTDVVFPGFWALPPCLGAFLYIAGGTDIKQNSLQLLTHNKILIFIGVISYSLYLWHWPVFVFFRNLSAHYNLLFFNGILITASFVISVFSWRFIERPIRLSPLFKKRKILWGATAASFMLMFAVCDRIQNFADTAAVSIRYTLPEARQKSLLSIKSNSNSHILLIAGDSHAQSQAGFFLSLTQKNNLNGSYINLRTEDNEDRTEYFDYYKTNQVDMLFLLYRLPWYLEKNNTQPINAVDSNRLKSPEKMYEFLHHVINQAVKNGVKHIFIQLPLPESPAIVPVIAHKYKTLLAYSDKSINLILGESMNHYNKRIEESLKIYQKLKQKFPQIRFINPAPSLYDNNLQRFKVINNNISFYQDGNHLSAEGAELLRPLYEKIFNDIKNNTIQDYYQ